MKTALVLMSIGFLAACNSIPTDVHYGPVGAVAGIDGGYSELRRGIDTWAVRYTGDQYMTGTTVRDLTLLRCAEIAKKAGFQWFVITDKINESGHDLRDTTVNANPVQYTDRSSSGASSGQMAAKTSTAGPGEATPTRMSNTRFISQYRYEIKCFREDPGDAEALDAAVVESELRAKYGISE